MYKELDDELEYGRGRRSNLDNFSLDRYFQKGYSINRFTKIYIGNCLSNDPQAVFKIISFGRGSNSAKAMLEYVNHRDGKEIAKDDLDDYEKTNKGSDGLWRESVAQDFYTESGEVLKGSADIKELYSTWSSEFRRKGSGRGEQRHLTHMLLSSDVEPTQQNADRVLASARQTLWDEFGQFGFEYTYVLHTDTENPHVHCILKNYNNHSKRKLRLDRHDLLRIRTDFANGMAKQGLKKHVATLRRDRPETLLRVQDNIAKIKASKKLMHKTLDACSFYNRKTRLNAQLNKQPRAYDYDGIKLKFDTSNSKFFRIVANKKGAHIEKALKKICIDRGYKDFNIGYDEMAVVNVRDIKDIKIADRKTLVSDFNKLIENKKQEQNKRMIKRTKDVMMSYKSALTRTNKTIRWIKRSNLSFTQKRDTIKELMEVKNELLNNYDLDKIKDAHTIVSGRIGAAAAKELLQMQEDKKEPSAKDFSRRYISLQAYLKTHREQIKTQTKLYRKSGDHEIVNALKAMISNRDLKKYRQAQGKVRDTVLNRS